ncbi:Ig domain-containing protein [Candidatus Deferrimicrobium sp.]|uniref:Ig domain-containing protein n=1 Tax=Candidatus Deferrimicrobium sp. TaxID=3060586 RepID=UPI002EDB5F87
MNENWTSGDFLGLDNDGDNLYDASDPNCASVTAGPMTVTPAGGLTSSGTAGGPFTPSSLSYTVTNTGTASMNWTASKAQSWVTLSATGGTLAAGGTATVIASINSGANSLAAGGYSDNVTFTNTTNGTGNTTRPVSLTVNAAEAPTISTVSLPAGAVDTAYSQTLAATGGTTPYSWSVSAGTLPAGLSLSATGVLDGMPTAEGTSTFTVRVEGANGASSTKDFSVTINAAAPPPTVNLSSDSDNGWGCSVAGRTGSGGSAIDGTLILAGLGLTVWGIRIRRRRG